MKESDKHILVVGLPETGKSSYIHALDEALRNPEPEADMKSAGLASSRAYLHRGKPSFMAGEPLDRTVLAVQDNHVELWFEHVSSRLKGCLYLPDEKGEVFMDQWVNRRWEKKYADSLRKIDGMLVFIRSDQNSRNQELLGCIPRSPEAKQAPRDWQLRSASHQTQLVDILQFIIEEGIPKLPIRTAVIISAWDTVGGRGDLRPQIPSAFLKREWALLEQYLSANPESLLSNVYGVSAYGGVPDKLGPLLEKPPHERAWITDSKGRSKDIAKPIKWVLDIST